ncbi:MAG: hypothetical protein K0R90_589 [Oscillospiraceae bacterium]|jgi:serine/threonine-protein kinase|nr:hypothetical protein [Oscillospiraceae bacterium]
MVPDNKRCAGCMKDIGNNTVCPFCGYIEGTPHLPMYLAPNTVLSNRYVVGKVLNYNGEGVTYIAFDKEIESVIELREYLPDALANREEDNITVHVIPGCETQYKALMSDFIELAKNISKMRTLTRIIQVYEVFEENNTAYAVHEHIDGGVSLRQYLIENAGELNWEETSKMFMPILNTLSLIHGSNIIHRGIAPETIIVTKKNELKLGGFCISSARAARTELSAQLFSGYAAPEQYSASSWHGPWTDVYSIAAVLYKALTGTMPPEAMSRSINDNLLAPHILNTNVPKHVSNAIMLAMKLSPDNRMQTIKELETKLFDATGDGDVVSISDSQEEVEPKSRKKYWLIATGITGGILLIVAALIIIFVSSGNNGDTVSLASIDIISKSSSKATNSETLTYGMPNLVGQLYDSVKINQDYTMMLKIIPQYEYNEEYQKGTIFRQSIKFETPVELNTEVTVMISRGTQFPKIPDFYGLKENEYIAELNKLGIKNKVEYVENLEKENGYVSNLSRDVNTTIDIAGNEVLTVFIVRNPDPVSSQQTQSYDFNYDDYLNDFQ